MKMSRFLLVGASLAAFALAGCNDAQKAQAEAVVTQACVVGATVGVQVAAGPAAVPFSQIITDATPLACGVLVQAAAQAVDAITAQAGTATVKVTTTVPETASSAKRTMRRMLRVTHDSVVVVPPDFGS